jgi:DNA-3-methyladenine glycosylase II
MEKLLRIPDYWQQGIAHMQAQDTVMAALIARYPDSCLRSRGDVFHTLMRSIVGQQISVKAADAVWGRMEQMLGHVTHVACIDVKEEAWRACGLSRQKIHYIQQLCLFMSHHAEAMTHEALSAMEDASLMPFITSIKGIGRWSAEMFMIFCLMHPNVLPLDDIGLQRAMSEQYGIIAKPFDKVHAQEIAKNWSPYCTIATWYLWRSIDPSEVHY